MKVALIEDESLAAKRLQTMISSIDSSISIEAVLPSIKESVKFLSAHGHLDLLFMDIHLDDGQSFSIFEQIDVSIPVIFTTAYDEYMVKAFKVNSIDYLLKPIDESELRQAIEKFRKLHSENRTPISEIKSFIETALQPKEGFKNRFMVSMGNKIRSVAVEEVAYFFSEDKVSFLVTREGRKFPVDLSLEKLTTVLDPSRFFRINRQYLIGIDSLDEIVRYSPSRLKIKLNPESEKDIFVSTEKYAQFKNWLDA